MDFFSQVPLTLKENLEYRIEIRKRAQVDKDFRRALWLASRHDVLFFFSAFCFLYEPRPRYVNGKEIPQVIPFIPWEHQIPVIRTIKEALGRGDVGLEKSRGEGASWIASLLALHDWLFLDDVTVGMCSSTDAKADKPNDRGSLLGKLDWELTVLPPWMAGQQDKDWVRNRSDHTLFNLRNKSLIVSSAATAGTGRSHRYRWFFLDEMSEWTNKDAEGVLASLQQATESRLFAATPLGAEGPYYDIMHRPSNMVKVVLDWSKNPYRNRGLYRLHGKQIAAVSANNPLFTEYNPPTKETYALFDELRQRGFDLEKGVRSPWYDRECDRAGATPQSIAQELDRDYGGSVYRIFGSDFDGVARKTVFEPKSRGVWGYHPETMAPDFDPEANGPVRLWCSLDLQNRPPRSHYVLGGDVSTGQGGAYTSNSALVVIDLVSMEQVMEYATNTVPPSEFAEVAVSMAKWFHDAFLIWEHNGPGTAFTKRVMDLHYPNVYRRKVIWRRGKQTRREVGWWTDGKTIEHLFGELGRAVKSGELVIRSRALARECGQYVRLAGKIKHVGAAKTSDDAVTGDAHGDRVIALGVALQGARDRPLGPRTKNIPLEIPPNCMAARQGEYEAALRKKGSSWDSRTTFDLMRS